VNVPSDIAVIRARLPYVDRRALSEAWYAVLHVCERMPSVPMKSAKHDGTTAVARAPRTVREARAANDAAPATAVSRSTQAKKPAPDFGAVPQRRATTARKAGGAPPGCDRPAPRFIGESAAFTVSFGEARVRIIARSDGARIHLTAVCSSRHADVVRRALAHASLGLRSYGAVVDTAVRCEVETE
jgi:hypothetical protein